jgi:CxxC motif-containing protein
MKKMICVMCPAGCDMEVSQKVSCGEISVAGNDCKKGEVYARIEFINPQRVVTALFPVEGGKAVSCKTSAAVDKDLIFEIIKEIKSREAVKPVKIGDVLIENVLNTGVDVVATSNMI